MISRERNREFRANLASIYARCRETGRRNFEPQAPDGADSRFGALSIRAKLQESLSGKGGSLQDFAPRVRQNDRNS